MRIFDIVGMCFRNLWRRKMRTLLTVFGVVIGATAIVVMISLGLGATEGINMRLKTMGDLHIVKVYGSRNGGGNMVIMGGGNSSGESEPAALTEEALEKIKAIDGVTAVMPKLSVDSQMFSISTGKNNRYKASWLELNGVDIANLELFGYKISEGAIPQGTEENFMVFGKNTPYQFRDTRKKRFATVWPEPKPDGTVTPPFFNPMEENFLLSINNKKKPIENSNYGDYASGGRGYEHKLKVPARMAVDEGGSSVDWSAMYSVFIDMDFAKQIIEDYNRLNGIKDKKGIIYNEMSVYVEDLKKIKNVQKEIDAMQFNSFGMDSIRESMEGQIKQLQMLLGGLAAISLFVAAIGITNTMIMSIYERTREIGVMKVLGCYIKNIRQTFLMEAGCIGLFGGIIGCGLSYGISAILNVVGVDIFGEPGGYVDPSLAEQMPTSIIPIWLILLALAFSTVIGVISGFGPANRAVKISALEAIKND